MILKLVISFLCWCLYVSTVHRQPSAAQADGLTENCNGIPVPYYLCNNGSINRNGDKLIDIRTITRTNIDLEDNQVEANKTDSGESESSPPAPLIHKSTRCGIRHSDGVGFRITGDVENEAQFGEFPWMVAVLNTFNVYQCGGALIHPQMVVTSAQCVSGKSKGFKIRAGEWDTQSTQEIYPHQDRDVQDVIVHPQFYADASYNDIAVLYLKSPLEIADNVDTICLPPQGTVAAPGTTCYATGWGKDIFGKKGKYQEILKKIDLPIVKNEECQGKLRTTRLGEFFELHKSFVCAGGVTGKDTCTGDGGGPLVCPIPGNEDRYYQVGIVSWGIGCGGSNTPGVYANLALFNDWIDAQMKSFSLDTSFYQY